MLVTVTLALLSISSTFSLNHMDPDFRAWLDANLTPDQVAAILRDDVVTGSFGGGVVPAGTTDRPIILVHGLNNEAGNFWGIRANFTSMGFPVQRIFATTWGPGAEAFNPNIKMQCSYVQSIRNFIQVVLDYTGVPQVDVGGYSMGSPLARKAILGGKCVDDSSVDLGPPLTDKIHTYLSVAGANQGSYLCPLFPLLLGICDSKIGLACGIPFQSKFLKNINTPTNYESSFKTFSIASKSDEVAGYQACGKRNGQFSNAQETTITGYSHTETEYNTADIQLPLYRQA